MRRVVITARAAVSPVGSGSSFFPALLAGTSGVSRQEALAGLPIDIAATSIVQLPALKPGLSAALSRNAQLLLTAAGYFLKEPGTEDFVELAPQCGVFVGNGAGGVEVFEGRQALAGARVSPLVLPKVLPNMAAAQLSIFLNTAGPLGTSSAACAAGSEAICMAVQAIRSGECEVALAAGTEAGVTPIGISSFHALGALASGGEDPSAASRPFDRQRSGFVMGEGAGILLLEEYSHAKARGAPILAELLGFGRTTDHFHYVAMRPDGELVGAAMSRALSTAGLVPEQIDYIAAHGTGTAQNDLVETAAIKRALGDHAYKVAISANKSMIGHTLGASGLLSMIATVDALQQQRIPPTINLTDPDPELDLDYVPLQARAHVFDRALVNAFAFGGHNVSIAVGRIDD